MSTINLAVCLQCGTILHSKHRHDFVACLCPNGSVADGGPDYKKRMGVDLSKVKDCNTMAEARRVSAGIKEKNEKKMA